nr:hypothetical protein [uncultured Butyrivibrio sp.]
MERFKVTTEDGKVINMTLELAEHGGFEYGNGHSLILTEVGLNESIFDARYDERFDTEESFRKHALEFVKEHVRSTCVVEKEDI